MTMKNFFRIAWLAASTLSLALPQLAAAQSPPRFPELSAEQLTPAQKKWVDSVSAPPRGANYKLPPYRIYMRSPELAERITGMSDYLRWNTQFPARLTEFAILLSARNWNSHWIWRGHYKQAIKGGFDPKTGAELAAGKRPSAMLEDEAVLYDLATEIFRDKKVSDATYAAALAKFGENGIVELIGLMGYYDLVAMLLIAGNAMPPADPEVPTLQAVAR
jgi:4-carboxymuconolactone decarboxylase